MWRHVIPDLSKPTKWITQRESPNVSDVLIMNDDNVSISTDVPP